MTLHDVLEQVSSGAGITTAIAIVGFLGMIVGKVFNAAGKITLLVARVGELDGLEKRLETVEDKISTLWGFMLSRGIAEAISKGVATMNSPIIVTPEAMSWLDPVKEPLQQFYQAEGYKLSDADLAFELERKFGEIILREICIPHGLYMGACLVIAIQACRSHSPAIQTIYPPGKDRRIVDLGPPGGTERRQISNKKENNNG